MSEDTGFNWVQAWGGALIVGVVVFAVFLVLGFTARLLPTLALGVILLLLIATAAWWAYRGGNREVAIGMTVGYAVLSLISAGQCTLFTQEQGDQALLGFVGYPVLLAVALLIGGIYNLINRMRRGKEMDQ
ncbi:MAG TPA: hypothetical protein VMS99_01320 [Acidimicrobiia bacterium]|nr:hypothetical protein [Acidimicrobiia bacterium]